MSEFTVEATKRYSFRRGWGVYFIGIYNEDDSLEDIEGGIVEIHPDKIEILPGPTPCILDENGCYQPVENFKDREPLWEDDTHDFRDRWFEYESDARQHLVDTIDRWKNPQPWESFVTFG